MFIMNQCIICLEETNNMFVNNNCVCKYRVHQRCLDKWLPKKCIICKRQIEEKQSLLMSFIVRISKPFIKIMFFPLLITYFLILNVVYCLNVCFANPYINEGR